MGDREDVRVHPRPSTWRRPRRSSGRPRSASGCGDGGPRCTPTVDGDMVFGLGTARRPGGCQAADGKEVWRKNFDKDFGGKMMSGWGYSESPLVDGDKLICTPGGKDAHDGRPQQEDRRDGLEDAAGRARRGRVRLARHLRGRRRAAVRHEHRARASSASTPRPASSSGPTRRSPTAPPTSRRPSSRATWSSAPTATAAAGSSLKLSADGAGGVKAEEFKFLAADKFQNHHGGMVLVGDYLYAGSGHVAGQPTASTSRPARSPGTATRSPATARPPSASPTGTCTSGSRTAR